MYMIYIWCISTFCCCSFHSLFHVLFFLDENQTWPPSFLTSCFLPTEEADQRHPLLQQFTFLPIKLKTELDGLLQFLGRLTDLPSASYTRSDPLSITASVQLSSAGHLFHVYLDLTWNALQALYELWIKLGELVIVGRGESSPRVRGGGGWGW